MRQFETLASEMNFAAWCAIQGNRCLSLDTIVETENGKIEIGNIKIGDKILTHKGFKNVDFVFPIEKQVSYKIITKSGKEIICSAKHQFPTNKGLHSISSGLCAGQKLLTKKNY
jgi:hypothetical protein